MQESDNSKMSAADITFAIGGFYCCLGSLLVAESAVLRMKFCGKNPRHHKHPKA